MKRDYFRSVLLPLFLIPAGGILILGVCYLLYFAVYTFVESLFFASDPTSVPAGIIRNSFSVAILILFLVLNRIKIFDLLKAIILIGPLTMLIIAAVLAFYEMQVLAIAAIVVIAACCIFLLHWYKKPWIYYYAAAVSVIAAIAYAWPRA